MSNKLEMKPDAFFVPAFLLLVLPWQWVGAAVVAAGVHELSHLLAIKLTGGYVEKITLGGTGAVIQATSLDAFRECICALAGPLGSALLLLLFRRVPRIALCALVHCLYNLLPIFPLDGGRILRSILLLLLPPNRADSLERWICCGVTAVVLGGFFLVAIRYGAAVLFLGIWVILRNIRKNSLPIDEFGATMEAVNMKEYTHDPIVTTDPPHRPEARAVHRRRVQ